MNKQLAGLINERVENIKSYYKYNSKDKLSNEAIINNSYQIAKTTVDYLNLAQSKGSLTNEEYLECIEVFRRIYNVSCCSLQQSYYGGDSLIFGMIKE